jgi:hypothetical protein
MLKGIPILSWAKKSPADASEGALRGAGVARLGGEVSAPPIQPHERDDCSQQKRAARKPPSEGRRLTGLSVHQNVAIGPAFAASQSHRLGGASAGDLCRRDRRNHSSDKQVFNVAANGQMLRINRRCAIPLTT